MLSPLNLFRLLNMQVLKSLWPMTLACPISLQCSRTYRLSGARLLRFTRVRSPDANAEITSISLLSACSRQPGLGKARASAGFSGISPGRRPWLSAPTCICQRMLCGELERRDSSDNTSYTDDFTECS